MARSFGIVENKLEEAEFFLAKLEESIRDFKFITESKFYLSAFVSAARSITFTLQASLSDIPEFKNWYENQQEKLKNNKLARFFLDARNLSQKVGYNIVGGGSIYTDDKSKLYVKLFFQLATNEKLNYIPKEDVVSCCLDYFKLLADIVLDCYINFGNIIDENLFYFYQRLINTNDTLLEFKNINGYTMEWIQILDFIKDKNTEFLKEVKIAPIDNIFIKYLGVNRLGLEVE